MGTKISADIREKARRLIMSGTTRKDAAFILGISYNTVYLLTEDIKIPRRRATSKQEYLMKRLAEEGFYISRNSNDLGTLRLLKEKRGIRIARVRKTAIGFVRGKEIAALRGFLRYRKIHSISSFKLRTIEGAFGIKDTKKAMREIKSNNVKLTDYM